MVAGKAYTDFAAAFFKLLATRGCGILEQFAQKEMEFRYTV
jgi:hypothetical protein